MTSPEPEVTGSVWNRKSRGLRWETADQVEKGIVGSGSRKSRGLGRETADQVEKGSWAQDGVKSLEKRGRKVQSPSRATGGDPLSENNTKKIEQILYCHVILFSQQVREKMSP